MLKLKFNSGTVTTGNTIPFTVEFNSNNRQYANNNIINITKSGVYETIGAINVTSTAIGNYGVNIVADGNVVATYYGDSAVVGDTISIPLYELLRVIPTSILNGYAKLSFTAYNDITVAGGTASVKYIN